MKNGSLKNSVVLGALMLSAGAMAAELEVSMFYPADMATRSDVDIASEVVGFYHNLEWSNALMAEKGANLVLKPTKVSAITDGLFADAYTGVRDGRLDMMDGAGADAATDHGHIAMGLFNTQSGKGGSGQSFVYGQYTTPLMGTVKFGLAHGLSMSTNSMEANSRIMLHEALHTIGASHNASDAALFDSSNGYDYGYSTICDNGLGSIMDDSPMGALSEMSLSGAADCKGDNYADMVTFINTFAPQKQTHSTANDNQTVTLAVTENTSAEAFEFVATRSNTTSAETMTLYVAGGKGANSTPNSLIPMSVDFQLGSATSTPINVTFDDIYPLFEQAHSSYQSTYAVVIGTNEVQDTLVDLLDINTQWVYDENSEDTEDTDDSSAGASSGGSLGGIIVGLLLILGWRRR